MSAFSEWEHFTLQGLALMPRHKFVIYLLFFFPSLSLPLRCLSLANIFFLPRL